MPYLERKLQQFSQIMTMQATQIAACNRLHEVEERLARWLLMSADRVSTSSLGLTQEVIGQMLGTRRSSVTVAAGILQKAGLIAYTRGEVKIVQRAKLEQAACECYRLMRQQTEVVDESDLTDGNQFGGRVLASILYTGIEALDRACNFYHRAFLMNGHSMLVNHAEPPGRPERPHIQQVRGRFELDGIESPPNLVANVRRNNRAWKFEGKLYR